MTLIKTQTQRNTTMATFTFTCPHCQQKFEADEEWIGMQVECPACKQNITIAKETEQPKVVLKPVSADKKSANNPSDKGVLKSKVVIRCPKTEENEKLIIQTLSDELEGHFQSDIEQNGNEFKIRFLNVLTCKTVRIRVIPRSDDSYELVSEFSSKVSKAFFFIFGFGALLIFWGLFASIMSFIVGFLAIIFTTVMELVKTRQIKNNIQMCMNQAKKSCSQK